MPWNSSLPTFVDEDVPTAAQMTDYLENIAWLRAINKTEFLHGTILDYTTTSTNYVDISADFNRTLVTTGGPVLVMFSGIFSYTVANTEIDFDIRVDGTRLGSGADLTGPGKGRGYSIVANVRRRIDISVLLSLSAASHTFEIEWRVPSGTVTLIGRFQPRFHIYEL